MWSLFCRDIEHSFYDITGSYFTRYGANNIDVSQAIINTELNDRVYMLGAIIPKIKKSIEYDNRANEIELLDEFYSIVDDVVHNIYKTVLDYIEGVYPEYIIEAALNSGYDDLGSAFCNMYDSYIYGDSSS